MGQQSIPGIKVKHTIITPTCKENHGVLGAFELAIAKLKDVYFDLEDIKCNKEADFHLVLTIERERLGFRARTQSKVEEIKEKLLEADAKGDMKAQNRLLKELMRLTRRKGIDE